MTHTAFQPGDRVVLPPYGIGVVQGTCQRPVGGHDQAYYQVTFANTSSRAYVPVAAPEGAGLRAALTAGDMPALLASLYSESCRCTVLGSSRATSRLRSEQQLLAFFFLISMLAADASTTAAA